VRDEALQHKFERQTTLIQLEAAAFHTHQTKQQYDGTETFPTME